MKRSLDTQKFSYLKEKRREKLRKVSLHVKTEVIVVVMKGEKKEIILAVDVDKAYGSEVKMASKLLEA